MYRVIREAHVDHTLGGERASGWIPRPYAEHAAEELFGITSDDWSPAA
jgi:hypothetical protein